MTRKNEVATVAQGNVPALTTEKISSYLDSLGCPLDKAQRTQFIEISQAFGLNPFLREIYGIPYVQGKGTKDEKTIFSIIIGYETFIKRAERTGRLSGWKAWTEGNGESLKACVEIHRRDWTDPFFHEVYMEEYDQKNKMWREKPRTMLKKVAIGQAFRLCFPEELAGMPYLEEEIDTAYEEPVRGKPDVRMPDAVDVEATIIEDQPDVNVDRETGEIHDTPEPEKEKEKPKADAGDKKITEGQKKMLFAKMFQAKIPPKEFCKYFSIAEVADLPMCLKDDAISAIENWDNKPVGEE